MTLQFDDVTVKTIYSVDVVVNFLFQLIFIFPLFLGMVMYAKQFKTEEKQNLTEIKINYNIDIQGKSR